MIVSDELSNPIMYEAQLSLHCSVMQSTVQLKGDEWYVHTFSFAWGRTWIDGCIKLAYKTI